MPAFWDTSAIVHICVPGQASSRARRLVDAQRPVVWWAAAVEVRSALERLRSGGTLSFRAYFASRQRLDDLLASSGEVQPTGQLRDLACEQLERFRLRAADALHLAAALIWCKRRPRGRLFICNDERLAAAAHHAGFDTQAA